MKITWSQKSVLIEYEDDDTPEERTIIGNLINTSLAIIRMVKK